MATLLYPENFSSIQAAYNSANPGDTISIAAGTYNEVWQGSNSGTPGNPIVFEARSGPGTVFIDGQYSASLNNGFPQQPTCGLGEQPVYYGALFYLDNAAYIDVIGIEFTRGVSTGFRADNSNNIRFIDGGSYDNRFGGIWYQGSQNVELRNSRVSGNGNFAPFSRGASACDWPPGVAMWDVVDALADSNEIYQNWGEGIYTIGGLRVNWTNNEIWDNYALNVYPHYVEDMDLSGNVVYHTNDPTYNRGSGASSDIVLNMESQFSNRGYPTNRNIRIVNNLIVTRSTGINFWAFGGFTSNDIQIINNTVYVYGGGNGWENNGTYQNTQVHNNIFFPVSGSSTSGGNPAVHSNNHAPGSGINQVGAPTFVNTSSAGSNVVPTGFQQASGSLTIDAGDNGPAPSIDFFGAVRPQNGTVDVGFHEFDGVVSNNPPTVDVVNQTSTVNDSVNYQPTANDPEGQPLTWSASGLPPGLSINTSTGLITGTVTAVGSYPFTVTVSDGVNPPVSDSATWTVNDVVNPGDCYCLRVVMPVAPQADFFFDSAAPAGGDGSEASPWRSFLDATWVDGATYSIAGGPSVGSPKAYMDPLAPAGNNIEICANGYVEIVGPRPGILPENGETNYTVSSDTGVVGLDVTQLANGLIDGKAWHGIVVRNWQSDGIELGPNSTGNTFKYLESWNNGWVDEADSWDTNEQVCSNPVSVYSGSARAFANGAGIVIAGQGNLFEYILSHNNGQDPVRSATGNNNLGNTTFRHFWFHNLRPNTRALGDGGPINGPLTQSFNYGRHADGIHVFDGSANLVSGLDFQRGILGPGVTNAAILGEVSRVDVDDIIFDECILVGHSDNGLFSNNGSTSTNWMIIDSTVFSDVAREHHAYADSGSGGWQFVNSVVAGNQGSACVDVNFFGASAPAVVNSYLESGITQGSNAGSWNQQAITLAARPTGPFDINFDLTSPQGGTPHGTIGATLGATITPGVNGRPIVA